MPISVARTRKQEGFSLIEILVALTLIALGTILGINAFESDRQQLESTFQEMDRTIRYAVNEAITRNSIVRIRFNLEVPQDEGMEFIVEYGDGADLVLPQAVDTSKMSIKEREEEVRRSKKLDNQFTPTSFFENGPKKLNENIRIYGIGSTYHNQLIIEGEPSLYFYPSGEKDSAIIILYTPDEMATLKVSPFEDRTYDDYYVFTQDEIDFFDRTLESKSKELFLEWSKE